MTDVVVSVSDGVALVTLNRPHRRNAYTASMGAMLNDAYRRCDDDDAVRAIVLTGAGDGCRWSASVSREWKALPDNVF